MATQAIHNLNYVTGKGGYTRLVGIQSFQQDGLDILDGCCQSNETLGRGDIGESNCGERIT